MRMSPSESALADKKKKEISDLAISIYVQDCESVQSSLMGGPENGLHEANLHPSYISAATVIDPKQESATARLSSFIGLTASHEVRFRFPSSLRLHELANN
jgi:hypothetical protein